MGLGIQRLRHNRKRAYGKQSGSCESCKLDKCSGSAGGQLHSLALKDDGTVWAWGYNGYGQLGDGTSTDHYTPAQVSGLTNITAISAMIMNSVALKDDGTVWTWGCNSCGQVGNGTTANGYYPMQVYGLTGVIAIAAGGEHTIVAKADGSVWTWGRNVCGELGDGTTTNSYSPIQVPGLTGITAVAGGEYHSVALKSDGTVWTWGYNGAGQLGDGTGADKHTPVQVLGLPIIKAIAAGSNFTIALALDGSVWIWGENSCGQLGIGTYANSYSPVQIQTISHVKQISGGKTHTLAIKEDGTAWAWGANDYYQLGDGTSTTSTVPVQVQGLPANVQNVIIPHITFDMQKYIQGDTVQLTLKLTGTMPGDKTNSVAFDIGYDGDTFELLTGDPGNDVVNGYIPFNTNMDLGTGADKNLLVSYIDMVNDTSLQEGSKVFTAMFKVKSNPTPGTKTFTLGSVDLLDSDGKVYNVNNGDPVAATVEVTDAAVVQGYTDIYLGDIGSGLNASIISSLDQSKINETFSNLKFILKQNAADPGTIFNGSEVFLPDDNGNMATLDGNGKVKGKFRVYTQDCSKTLLTIGGESYIGSKLNISLSPGQLYILNTANAPTEIYPGDIGQIASSQLVLTPDGKVSNTDFSAWLKLYKSNIANTIGKGGKLRADFTKDGVIDNIDFSLWMASYKMVKLLGL